MGQILLFILLIAFPWGELPRCPLVAVTPKVHQIPRYTSGFE